LDGVLGTFDFLVGPRRASTNALVLTSALLDRAARAAERYLVPQLQPHGLSPFSVRILLAPPNEVRTVITGGVFEALPAPAQLWPPSWTLTIAETLTIQHGMPAVEVELPMADVALPVLERFFLFPGFFPWPGLAPGFLPMTAGEFLLPALVDGHTPVAVSGPALGLASLLLQYLPTKVLTPGPDCQKAVLQFDAIDVQSARPEGIRLQFRLLGRVAREPRVSIHAFVNPLRVRLSRLLSMPVPLVTGRYDLADVQDLRPDPRISWQATHAHVVPLGQPTSVDVYFDLSQDRDRFRVGARLDKIVSVTVTDADGCRAQDSFTATIAIEADPGPEAGGPPPGHGVGWVPER
jgi:hypothetical protein